MALLIRAAVLVRVPRCLTALPSARRWSKAGGRHPPRVLRTANQRTQVDLGLDAALQQPPVRVVVRLLGEYRKFLVEHRLQHTPVVERQRRPQPGRRHQARKHLRTQDVVRFQLLMALEKIDARPQVGELRRSTIHHRQGQPRTENLELDRVVVDQAQLHLATGRDRQLADQRRRQDTVLDGTPKHRRDRAEPGRRSLVEIADQGPAMRGDGGFGSRAGQTLGPLLHRLNQRRHAFEQSFCIRSPRLLSQCRRVGGSRHGFVRGSCRKSRFRLYTTAPALGSSGSVSFGPAFTRSSRFTPSHIAMAAATKTDE